VPNVQTRPASAWRFFQLYASRILRPALFACILTFCVPLSLAAREIVIQRFDDRIVIGADGTIEVTETIQAEFIGSNWHGILRTVPVEYITPQGLTYTLLLEPLSVTDLAGNPLKYERSSQGRNTQFKIYLPNPDNSIRTVVLRYRVLNALTYFDDHDELYWNVTGNESDIGIQDVTAQIELPVGVTGLHGVSYGGAFGSREQDATVESHDNSVQFRSTHSFGPREGLTVVVGWDKGFVREPTVAAKLLFILRANWPILIPFGVFLLMFWWWWTKGRDPERDAITVQYDPPDNLTPAECGTLVEGKAAMCGITATLVDLGVKGYLTIENQAGDSRTGSASDYIFHLNKPPAEWNALKPHEQQMLRGIFVPQNPAVMLLERLQDLSKNLAPALAQVTGAMAVPAAQPDPPVPQEYADASRAIANLEKVPLAGVALSDLQNRFSLHLPIIRRLIFDALQKDGYYARRPDGYRKGIVVLGFLVGFLMLPAGLALTATTGTAPVPWVLAAVTSGVIIAVFAMFMSGRTVAGSRAYAKVLGFEEFLGRVQKDQIERLENAPELFEKYLPYAMALHVEKKWVQAFSRIAMQPPQWYQGVDGAAFQPSIFVDDLNVMSSHAETVMTSSSRSSGDWSSSGATSGSGFSSGGSDGGSSGGGFGGGSVGGF